MSTEPSSSRPLPLPRRASRRIATVLSALVALGFFLTLTDAGSPPARARTAAANRLVNASFEHTLAPWGGTHLQRRRLASSPAGRFVVQASAVHGRLAIDDWPGEVRSVSGTAYTGRMYLRAAAQSAVGKRVSLVVREHTAGGQWVASTSVTSTLTRRFQPMRATLRALRRGDVIDLYAYERRVAATDSFFAERAWLSARSTSGQPRPLQRATPIESATSPAPVARTGSTVGELSIDTGQADYLGDTSRYGYVILQEYMYARVADIKRANPDTVVLAYLEAPVTQTRTCGDATPPAYSHHDAFGVNYCYAAAHHPSWFLTGPSGNRFTYSDYPRSAVMDIGNVAYQNTWAANAIAAAEADGFDGIYLDNVNTYPGHGVDGQLAEYTDQAYGQAMAGFVASVADQLRAGGLLAVANVAANPWVGWQRADALALAAHLTALDREHYARYGDICGPFSERFNTTATNGTPPIADLLAYDQAVQETGAHLLGIDYGYPHATAADRATMSYGRAMFLLAWDGRPGSAYLFRPCGTVDPADPTWLVDLGAPAGAMRVTDGVYERRYSAGLVLLNASRATPATVAIPSGYVSADGAPVTTATLPPQGAMLLRDA